MHSQLRVVINYEAFCSMQIMTFQVIYTVPHHPNFKWESILIPFLKLFVQSHQPEFFPCGTSPSGLLLTSNCQKFL